MQADAAALSEEARSKDEFYRQLTALTNAMTAAHGQDFTVGTLVLAARFMVQEKTPGPVTQGSGLDTH